MTVRLRNRLQYYTQSRTGRAMLFLSLSLQNALPSFETLYRASLISNKSTNGYTKRLDGYLAETKV